MEKNKKAKISCSSKEEAQKVMAMVLYLGQLLVKYGAEIYRTEDTISRICGAYTNLESVDVFGLTNGLFLSLEYEQEVITMYKSANNDSLDLEKIDALNTFSRDFVKSPKDLTFALKELKEIENRKELNPKLQVLASGLASAFFSLLFGACGRDAICTFFVGSISYCLVSFFSQFDFTFFIDRFLGAFFSSALASLCIHLKLGLNIDHIIIGAIMLFVPGVTITNAIRDIMSDDFLSGLIGLVKALFIALAIAIGVGLVLHFYLKWGR